MNKKLRDVDLTKAMPRRSVLTYADREVMVSVLVARVEKGGIAFTAGTPEWEKGRLLVELMERMEEQARKVVLGFLTSMMIQARKSK